MTLTPQQARVRLTEARRKMKLISQLSRGRETFDPQAGLAAAVEELIKLLEDALA